MQVQYVVQYLCDDYDYALSRATPSQAESGEVEFVTLSHYKTRELAEQGYGRYMKVFQNLLRITIEEANYGTRAKRC
jgi:hypothetical protein